MFQHRTAHHFRVLPAALGRERIGFERAGSYVNIRRIGYTVHSDRFRCVFFFTDDRNVSVRVATLAT